MAVVTDHLITITCVWIICVCHSGGGEVGPGRGMGDGYECRALNVSDCLLQTIHKRPLDAAERPQLMETAGLKM